MISKNYAFVSKNYLFMIALFTQFACQGHQYNSFEMEEQGFHVQKKPSESNTEAEKTNETNMELPSNSELQFEKKTVLLFELYRDELQELKATIEKLQYLQSDTSENSDSTSPFASSEANPTFSNDEGDFEALVESLRSEGDSEQNEIIFAIKTLKLTKKYLEQEIEPKESNLTTESSTGDDSPKTYLEMLEQEKLDLTTALQNNFYLKHTDALQAIKVSILLGSESKKGTAINATLAILNRIGEKLVSDPLNNAENSEANESLTLSPKAESVNIEELADDEEKLEKAESLASTGKFVEAIRILKSVSSESAMFDPAREKIIEFSDQGVNHLRRKAAQAFQSALPIADVETRSDYLKNAKTYLEDAKRNFPQSKQLTIVENNLKMINRKLNQVKLR